MIYKLSFALQISARNLRHYFGSHTVVVLISQLLKNVLTRLKVVGILAQISIKLGQYNIKYISKTIIKGQVMVEFFAEFSESP